MTSALFLNNQRMENSNGQQKIVSELLANAIYLRVPKTSIDKNNYIQITEDLDRTLFLWYNEQDHIRAISQKNAIENWRRRFSSRGNVLHKPYRKETPYEAMERCKEKFGLKVPIEIAQHVLHSLDPNQWIIQRTCIIEYNST